MKKSSKRLLVVREFDPWKSPLCTCPSKYSLHPYTGCSHFCLYCYATSYIGLRGSSPKVDFMKKLLRDMEFIDRERIIELSTSSDPYPPIEKELVLTRAVLKELISRNLKILITTKSNIITRDIDIISQGKVAVMLTITTLDDKIAKYIEPGAPSPRERLNAIRELSKNGIPVGVRVDPIIPLVNDDPYEISELVGKIVENGALHVVTSTYKAKYDSLRRLEMTLPQEISSRIARLYREKSNRIHGYLYLPIELRMKMLINVVNEAKKHGLTYATCREGLKELNKAPSCDGSHLIQYKSPLRDIERKG